MDELRDKLKGYLLLITYGVLLYLGVSHLNEVLAFLRRVVTVLTPFILGLLFAFILNILMSFLERKLFYKLDKAKRPFLRKLKRPLSVIATFLILAAFITAIMLFLIPQLSQSVTTLTTNSKDYIRRAERFINDLAQRFHLVGEFWNQIAFNWNDIIARTTQFTTAALQGLLSLTVSLTNGIINFIMGLIVSVYLLIQKEKLIRIVKKLVYGFASRTTAERLIETGSQANKTFHNFVAGQLTEALILGGLVLIGMLIFGFPYAVLCGVIIAVTAIIPIFGAWIGGIPSAFIVLMAAPQKTLWFILFLFVLQQLEGNIIYPRVVGNSIGLDGLWVLFALIVGGSLFGIIGMLLGIPAFAVFYVILRRITHRKLREKNIVVE